MPGRDVWSLLGWRMSKEWWEAGGRQVGESQRAGDREQRDFLRQAGRFWASMNSGVSWG